MPQPGDPPVSSVQYYNWFPPPATVEDPTPAPAASQPKAGAASGRSERPAADVADSAQQGTAPLLAVPSTMPKFVASCVVVVVAAAGSAQHMMPHVSCVTAMTVFAIDYWLLLLM